VTAAASALSKRISADRILALTYTGYSARLLAACRPGVTILAATPDPEIARGLGVFRAVMPLVVDRPARIEEAIPLALEEARRGGHVRSGDKVVVCASRTSPRSDADTLWLHSEP
jgi:pyruvate kinase